MSSSIGGSGLVVSKTPSLPVLVCACASLRRAGRAVTQAYAAEVRGTGGNPTQLTLLHILARLWTSTQQTLGALLAHDPTTLSRTLQPLESKGWIKRRPGADRRERYWDLTPAGRRQLARALPAWERAQGRLRGRLG